MLKLKEQNICDKFLMPISNVNPFFLGKTKKMTSLDFDKVSQRSHLTLNTESNRIIDKINLNSANKNDARGVRHSLISLSSKMSNEIQLPNKNYAVSIPKVPNYELFESIKLDKQYTEPFKVENQYIEEVLNNVLKEFYKEYSVLQRNDVFRIIDTKKNNEISLFTIEINNKKQNNLSRRNSAVLNNMKRSMCEKNNSEKTSFIVIESNKSYKDYSVFNNLSSITNKEEEITFNHSDSFNIDRRYKYLSLEVYLS